MFLYIITRIWPSHHTYSRVCLPFFSFCCCFFLFSSLFLSPRRIFFFILIVACDSCWNSDMLRVIDSLRMIKRRIQCKDLSTIALNAFPARNSTRFCSFKIKQVFFSFLVCSKFVIVVSEICSADKNQQFYLILFIFFYVFFCCFKRIRFFFFKFVCAPFVIYGFCGFMTFGVKFQRLFTYIGHGHNMAFAIHTPVYEVHFDTQLTKKCTEPNQIFSLHQREKRSLRILSLSPSSFTPSLNRGTLRVCVCVVCVWESKRVCVQYV